MSSNKQKFLLTLTHASPIELSGLVSEEIQALQNDGNKIKSIKIKRGQGNYFAVIIYSFK